MKKVVSYDTSKGVRFIGEGERERALVWPIDHPDTDNVSNKREALTSCIVQKHDDGSFETLNSLYVPGVRVA